MQTIKRKVINRKRLAYIAIFVSLPVFAFVFRCAKENNTVATMAVPVTNKTIVIDAGHGSPDEGASSDSRNNRGKNKFSNSIKITEFAGTKWSKCCINTFG